ncbi:MAG: hypothetical protein QG553_209 [Patescibacteria group bacterium]|nr:hypothetical protein [Patescibacteria group bacterium]
MNIADSTAERLEGYGVFSPDAVDAVAEFADFQASFKTYQEFLASQGITEDMLEQKGLPYIDIRPTEHDPAEALAIHLPMANPLDANQLYAIATIAGTNPNKRVVAFANPSGPGYDGNWLMHSERHKVVRGNGRPLVAPLDHYLSQAGIDTVDHYGYSYGVEKALAASMGHASVKSLILLEPASVESRNLVSLGLAFAKSAGRLEEYVQACNLPTFEDAREDSVGALSYNIGLARLTNLAIARYIGQGRFFANYRQALLANHNASATVAWGSESELASDDILSSTLDKPGYRQRSNTLRLVGHGHAVANDIHVQAAVVLEGLAA